VLDPSLRPFDFAQGGVFAKDTKDGAPFVLAVPAKVKGKAEPPALSLFP